MAKAEIIKSSQLVKVTTDRLQLGMYVSELDRPWLGTPFLFQGFPITGDEDLGRLQHICDYVFVDVQKSKPLSRGIKHRDISNIKRTQYENSIPVEQEVARAYTTYRDTLSQIQSMLDDATKRGIATPRVIKSNIKRCVESIIRNPNALIWLAHIKHKSEYELEHALHVAILAMAVGRQLGLPRQQLETLGMCGVLHDIGKTRINDKILNKTENLTDTDFEALKSHVSLGRDMLLDDPLLPTEVVEAAYCHHERIDGRGYPEGRPAETLSFYTRIISIADSYDAMTSRRNHAASVSSAKALKILYNSRGKQFDRQLVVTFIQCVGLYPPGCLVEMNSGEAGVVIAADPNARLLPKVALLRDRHKKPTQQTIIDLKKQSVAAGKIYQITRVLRDGSHGIWLEEFTHQNINLNARNAILSP
ncbi:MAG: HD-GYP domain-containing protein [Pseudomonadales bacterium]